MRPRLLVGITVVLLSFGLAGCPFWINAKKYLMSEPTLDSTEISISKSGWLEISGSFVAIRPRNKILIGAGSGYGFSVATQDYPANLRVYDPTYYEGKPIVAPNYFIVELRISTGSNDMRLAFRDFRLKNESSSVQPSNYFRLEPRYGSSAFQRRGDRGEFSLCKSKDQPSYSAANPLRSAAALDVGDTVKLEEEQEYCFAIKYDVAPPHPSRPFRLQVGGIDVNEKAVVLNIQYNPVTRVYEHNT